jgi:hypothetical protein
MQRRRKNEAEPGPTARDPVSRASKSREGGALGYMGDALDPGDAGIRLFMYPQGILEGSGPKPVFGVVPTSTASVELRSGDGSSTAVSVYALPEDYASQAKAFLIPAPTSGVISGTLVALDAQGNEIGRLQIPDAQEAQSPSPQP